MKCFDRLLKTISWVLIQALLFEPLATAAPELSAITTDLFSEKKMDLGIPRSVATVESFYEATASQKTLYLIQDAHTNESGQRNLSKTIEALLHHERGLRYVFVEAGKDDTSLSHLRSKADLKARVNVAERYLKKGLLHGEEFLELTSDLDFSIWGVEDVPLYLEAIENYKKSAKDRARYQNYLKRIRQSINTLKVHFYSPSLLALEGKQAQFFDQEISLTDYFEVLLNAAMDQGIHLSAYPHLAAFKNLKVQEKDIDFKLASTEQAKALESLNAEDRQALMEEAKSEETPRLQSLDQKELQGFYSLLHEKISSGALILYPNLSRYFAYLDQAQRIDPTSALLEQRQLEETLFDGLALTEDEKELLRCQKNLRLLQKLFDLSLTPQEYAEYKDESQGFKITHLTGYLNKKIMDLGRYYERALFLEGGYETMVAATERFYELTYDRDQAFLNNALSKMEQESQNTAVLITGGFHTPNLKALLRQKNISYVVLTPQVTCETNQKRYESILFNQKINTNLLPSKPLDAMTARAWAFVQTPAISGLVGELEAGAPSTPHPSPSTSFAPPTGSRLAGDGNEGDSDPYVMVLKLMHFLWEKDPRIVPVQSDQQTVVYSIPSEDIAFFLQGISDVTTLTIWAAFQSPTHTPVVFILSHILRPEVVALVRKIVTWLKKKTEAPVGDAPGIDETLKELFNIDPTAEIQVEKVNDTHGCRYYRAVIESPDGAPLGTVGVRHKITPTESLIFTRGGRVRHFEKKQRGSDKDPKSYIAKKEGEGKEHFDFLVEELATRARENQNGIRSFHIQTLQKMINRNIWARETGARVNISVKKLSGQFGSGVRYYTITRKGDDFVRSVTLRHETRTENDILAIHRINGVKIKDALNSKFSFQRSRGDAEAIQAMVFNLDYLANQAQELKPLRRRKAGSSFGDGARLAKGSSGDAEQVWTRLMKQVSDLNVPSGKPTSGVKAKMASLKKKNSKLPKKAGPSSRGKSQDPKTGIEEAIFWAPAGKPAVILRGGWMDDVLLYLVTSDKFPVIYLVDDDRERVAQALQAKGIDFSERIKFIYYDFSVLTPGAQKNLLEAVQKAERGKSISALTEIYGQLAQGSNKDQVIAPMPEGLDPGNAGLVISDRVVQFLAYSVIRAGELYARDLKNPVLNNNAELSNPYRDNGSLMMSRIREKHANLLLNLVSDNGIVYFSAQTLGLHKDDESTRVRLVNGLHNRAQNHVEKSHQEFLPEPTQIFGQPNISPNVTRWTSLSHPGNSWTSYPRIKTGFFEGNDDFAVSYLIFSKKSPATEFSEFWELTNKFIRSEWPMLSDIPIGVLSKLSDTFFESLTTEEILSLNKDQQTVLQDLRWEAQSLDAVVDEWFSVWEDSEASPTYNEALQMAKKDTAIRAAVEKIIVSGFRPRLHIQKGAEDQEENTLSFHYKIGEQGFVSGADHVDVVLSPSRLTGTDPEKQFYEIVHLILALEVAADVAASGQRTPSELQFLGDQGFFEWLAYRRQYHSFQEMPRSVKANLLYDYLSMGLAMMEKETAGSESIADRIQNILPETSGVKVQFLRGISLFRKNSASLKKRLEGYDSRIKLSQLDQFRREIDTLSPHFIQTQPYPEEEIVRSGARLAGYIRPNTVIEGSVLTSALNFGSAEVRKEDSFGSIYTRYGVSVHWDSLTDDKVTQYSLTAHHFNLGLAQLLWVQDHLNPGSFGSWVWRQTDVTTLLKKLWLKNEMMSALEGRDPRAKPAPSQSPVSESKLRRAVDRVDHPLDSLAKVAIPTPQSKPVVIISRLDGERLKLYEAEISRGIHEYDGLVKYLFRIAGFPLDTPQNDFHDKVISFLKEKIKDGFFDKYQNSRRINEAIRSEILSYFSRWIADDVLQGVPNPFLNQRHRSVSASSVRDMIKGFSGVIRLVLSEMIGSWNVEHPDEKLISRTVRGQVFAALSSPKTLEEALNQNHLNSLDFDTAVRSASRKVPSLAKFLKLNRFADTPGGARLAGQGSEADSTGRASLTRRKFLTVTGFAGVVATFKAFIDQLPQDGGQRMSSLGRLLADGRLLAENDPQKQSELILQGIRVLLDSFVEFYDNKDHWEDREKGERILIFEQLRTVQAMDTTQWVVMELRNGPGFMIDYGRVDLPGGEQSPAMTTVVVNSLVLLPLLIGALQEGQIIKMPNQQRLLRLLSYLGKAAKEEPWKQFEAAMSDAVNSRGLPINHFWGVFPGGIQTAVADLPVGDPASVSSSSGQGLALSMDYPRFESLGPQGQKIWLAYLAGYMKYRVEHAWIADEVIKLQSDYESVRDLETAKQMIARQMNQRAAAYERALLEAQKAGATSEDLLEIGRGLSTARPFLKRSFSDLAWLLPRLQSVEHLTPEKSTRLLAALLIGFFLEDASEADTSLHAAVDHLLDSAGLRWDPDQKRFVDAEGLETDVLTHPVFNFITEPDYNTAPMDPKEWFGPSTQASVGFELEPFSVGARFAANDTGSLGSPGLENPSRRTFLKTAAAAVAAAAVLTAQPAQAFLRELFRGGVPQPRPEKTEFDVEFESPITKEEADNLVRQVHFILERIARERGASEFIKQCYEQTSDFRVVPGANSNEYFSIVAQPLKPGQWNARLVLNHGMLAPLMSPIFSPDQHIGGKELNRLREALIEISQAMAGFESYAEAMTQALSSSERRWLKSIFDVHGFLLVPPSSQGPVFFIGSSLSMDGPKEDQYVISFDLEAFERLFVEKSPARDLILEELAGQVSAYQNQRSGRIAVAQEEMGLRERLTEAKKELKRQEEELIHLNREFRLSKKVGLVHIRTAEMSIQNLKQEIEQLSLKRAKLLARFFVKHRMEAYENLKDFMQRKGIDAGRLKEMAKGETSPKIQARLNRYLALRPVLPETARSESYRRRLHNDAFIKDFFKASPDLAGLIIEELVKEGQASYVDRKGGKRVLKLKNPLAMRFLWEESGEDLKSKQPRQKNLKKQKRSQSNNTIGLLTGEDKGQRETSLPASLDSLRINGARLAGSSGVRPSKKMSVLEFLEKLQADPESQFQVFQTRKGSFLLKFDKKGPGLQSIPDDVGISVIREPGRTTIKTISVNGAAAALLSQIVLTENRNYDPAKTKLTNRVTNVLSFLLGKIKKELSTKKLLEKWMRRESGVLVRQLTSGRGPVSDCQYYSVQEQDGRVFYIRRHRKIGDQLALAVVVSETDLDSVNGRHAVWVRSPDEEKAFDDACKWLLKASGGAPETKVENGARRSQGFLRYAPALRYGEEEARTELERRISAGIPSHESALSKGTNRNQELLRACKYYEIPLPKRPETKYATREAMQKVLDQLIAKGTMRGANDIQRANSWLYGKILKHNKDNPSNPILYPKLGPGGVPIAEKDNADVPDDFETAAGSRLGEKDGGGQALGEIKTTKAELRGVLKEYIGSRWEDGRWVSIQSGGTIIKSFAHSNHRNLGKLLVAIFRNAAIGRLNDQDSVTLRQGVDAVIVEIPENKQDPQPPSIAMSKLIAQEGRVPKLKFIATLIRLLDDPETRVSRDAAQAAVQYSAGDSELDSDKKTTTIFSIRFKLPDGGEAGLRVFVIDDARLGLKILGVLEPKGFWQDGRFPTVLNRDPFAVIKNRLENLARDKAQGAESHGARLAGKSKLKTKGGRPKVGARKINKPAKASRPWLKENHVRALLGAMLPYQDKLVDDRPFIVEKLEVRVQENGRQAKRGSFGGYHVGISSLPANALIKTLYTITFTADLPGTRYTQGDRVVIVSFVGDPKNEYMKIETSSLTPDHERDFENPGNKWKNLASQDFIDYRKALDFFCPKEDEGQGHAGHSPLTIPKPETGSVSDFEEIQDSEDFSIGDEPSSFAEKKGRPAPAQSELSDFILDEGTVTIVTKKVKTEKTISDFDIAAESLVPGKTIYKLRYNFWKNGKIGFSRTIEFNDREKSLEMFLPSGKRDPKYRKWFKRKNGDDPTFQQALDRLNELAAQNQSSVAVSSGARLAGDELKPLMNLLEGVFGADPSQGIVDAGFSIDYTRLQPNRWVTVERSIDGSKVSVLMELLEGRDGDKAIRFSVLGLDDDSLGEEYFVLENTDPPGPASKAYEAIVNAYWNLDRRMDPTNRRDIEKIRRPRPFRKITVIYDPRSGYQFTRGNTISLAQRSRPSKSSGEYVGGAAAEVVKLNKSFSQRSRWGRKADLSTEPTEQDNIILLEDRQQPEGPKRTEGDARSAQVLEFNRSSVVKEDLSKSDPGQPDEPAGKPFLIWELWDMLTQPDVEVKRRVYSHGSIRYIVNLDGRSFGLLLRSVPGQHSQRLSVVVSKPADAGLSMKRQVLNQRDDPNFFERLVNNLDQVAESHEGTSGARLAGTKRAKTPVEVPLSSFLNQSFFEASQAEVTRTIRYFKGRPVAYFTLSYLSDEKRARLVIRYQTGNLGENLAVVTDSDWNSADIRYKKFSPESLMLEERSRDAGQRKYQKALNLLNDYANKAQWSSGSRLASGGPRNSNHRRPTQSQTAERYFEEKKAEWQPVIQKLHEFVTNGDIKAYGVSGGFSRGSATPRDLDLALILKAGSISQAVADYVNTVNNKRGFVHLTLQAFGPTYIYDPSRQEFAFEMIRNPGLFQMMKEAGKWRNGNRVIYWPKSGFDATTPFWVQLHEAIMAHTFDPAELSGDSLPRSSTRLQTASGSRIAGKQNKGNDIQGEYYIRWRGAKADRAKRLQRREERRQRKFLIVERQQGKPGDLGRGGRPVFSDGYQKPELGYIQPIVRDIMKGWGWDALGLAMIGQPYAFDPEFDAYEGKEYRESGLKYRVPRPRKGKFGNARRRNIAARKERDGAQLRKFSRGVVKAARSEIAVQDLWMAVSLDLRNPTILRFSRSETSPDQVKVYVGTALLEEVAVKETQEDPAVSISQADLIQLLKTYEEKYTREIPQDSQDTPIEAWVHLDSFKDSLGANVQESILTAELSKIASRSRRYNTVHLVGSREARAMAFKVIEGLRAERAALFTFGTEVIDPSVSQVNLVTKSYYLANQEKIKELFQAVGDSPAITPRYLVMDDIENDSTHRTMDIVAFGPVLSLAEMIGSVEVLSKEDAQFQEVYQRYLDITGFDGQEGRLFMSQDDFLRLIKGEPAAVSQFPLPSALKAVPWDLAIRVMAMGARMALQSA